MISITYALSGLLLVVVGALFERDLLTAATQTIGWMIVFFVASPAASAGVPHRQRNLPDRDPCARDRGLLRHWHRSRGRRGALRVRQAHRKRIAASIFGGYVFAAVLMFAASFVAARYAVAAERKPLEEVATPLSAAAKGRPERVCRRRLADRTACRRASRPPAPLSQHRSRLRRRRDRSREDWRHAAPRRSRRASAARRASRR